MPKPVVARPPLSGFSNSGFSLVEMSIVLVVIGLLLLALLPSLETVRRSTQQNVTRENLESVMRATAAFVQANGCLPCPTPAGTTGTGFGAVAGVAGGPACAACTAASAEGLPPFAALGLSSAQIRDGWGRLLTYRVDPALTVNFGIVPPTAPCLAADLPPNPVTPTCTLVNASQKGLCRTGLSNANRVQVTEAGGATQEVAVIVLSHGANRAGAFDDAGNRAAFPATQPACGAASGFERCNADGNRFFAIRPLTPTGDDPFDDQAQYMSRNALVSLLGSGTCQTVW